MVAREVHRCVEAHGVNSVEANIMPNELVLEQPFCRQEDITDIRTVVVAGDAVNGNAAAAVVINFGAGGTEGVSARRSGGRARIG